MDEDLILSDPWDGVFGYVKTEYDIDANQDRVVMHLEYNGYFTGYYLDVDIRDEKETAFYRLVLDQMVKDLEKTHVPS